MNCQKCGQPLGPHDRWCEACGEAVPDASAAPVPAPAEGTCANCGAPASRIQDDVCTVCGEIVVRKKPRDHFDVRLDASRALLSDLGHVHYRNEDFATMRSVSLNGSEATIVVVSDGVSSAADSDLASEHACKAAADALAGALEGGRPRSDAVNDAVLAAQNAVLALPAPAGSKKDPPEATLLLLLVWDRQVDIAWVGDSRAYAVHPDGSAELLTRDHSWVNDIVDAGIMSLDEALQDRKAHALTQSLGRVPDGDEFSPSSCRLDLDGVRYLVACTDGFWNYAHVRQDQPPVGLIALMQQAAPNSEALDLARAAVDYANSQGGRDNVTVAVVALPATKGS
ncbi:MAG: protein phosphatase 2C domain-containing protein [Candidatus Xenobia bacterium]